MTNKPLDLKSKLKNAGGQTKCLTVWNPLPLRSSLFTFSPFHFYSLTHPYLLLSALGRRFPVIIQLGGK
jgi:hypothetical protein